ncbi:MAG: hypothetical protein KBD64_02320 [Gammaproteobacteria bacterium]|nr:hypothetical protein [Gammaproteobacteria bacterium]
MNKTNIKVWRAVIEHTLDTDYDTVVVSIDKAKALAPGLSRGKIYFLTIEAGFDIEIVKVTKICNECILCLERGQQGTIAGVWPAGTVLEGKITAQALDDLRLDPAVILASNEEVMVAPNGDLITKQS